MIRLMTALTALCLFASSAEAYHHLSWKMLYISGTDDADFIVVEVIRPRPDWMTTDAKLSTLSDRQTFDAKAPLGRVTTPEHQIRFTISDLRGNVIETATYPYKDITYLMISGGDGNDLMFNDTDLPSSMSGGRGSDLMSGGSNNDDMSGDDGMDWDDPDILFGNAGDDELHGGAKGQGILDLIAAPAADELYGGPGQDYLHGQVGMGLFIGNPNEPNDLLDGGSDIDTYEYYNWDFLVEFDSFGQYVTPDIVGDFLMPNIVFQ